MNKKYIEEKKITKNNRLFSVRQKLKRGNDGVWDYISDCTHILVVTDWLTTERRLSLFCRGFYFFKYHIILELRANFTVRRHILVLYFCFTIDWSYEEIERREKRKEKDGYEARVEGEGRWRDGGKDRGKERLEVTEEACEEDERCEEDSECHSVAKRARVCATFTDSQETAIVEFVKDI